MKTATSPAEMCIEGVSETFRTQDADLRLGEKTRYCSQQRSHRPQLALPALQSSVGPATSLSTDWEGLLCTKGRARLDGREGF